MSDTMAGIRRKVSTATDLQSVVRTMKALAASSIGQYEKSVSALADYYRTVELGLSVCLRESWSAPLVPLARESKKATASKRTIAAVVFGSDQGLVGQFNDVVTDYAVKTLTNTKPTIWAVGERVQARLTDAGFAPKGLFIVPSSVKAITRLVGQILVEIETLHDGISELHLFYNRPTTGEVYAPVTQRPLPFDESWRKKLALLSWPTKELPEVIGSGATVLRMLIREYLFISLFRACAESLASENASRLAAMQRADKNIDELLEDLNRTFHRMRQSGIDEELFDVISGFEMLNQEKK
ncbi:MAG: F0F1 ATP synthase subunit gamma [Oligoflexia bacterium]|nr:F0F1 ATP synthase subunit gamma [Oligoflexia bacterium]